MILSFKENLVQPIVDGTKIHTIRTDKTDRWTVGRKIDFWKGNPRNPQCNPYNFSDKVPHETTCQGIQSIQIYWGNSTPCAGVLPVIIVNGIKRKTEEFIGALAKNDGFHNWFDFMKWESWYFQDFEGKIIHWTNFRY
jgi:hypothetical protein